jgi:Tfp pilus assembly protein PilF
VQALKTASQTDPRDERFFYALANAYRRTGDAKRAAAAEARFRRISALHVEMMDLEARAGHDPTSADTRLRLARVYRDLGLGDKAAGQYLTVLRLRPNSVALAQEWRGFMRQQQAKAASQPRADQQVPQDFVLPSPSQPPAEQAPVGGAGG